MSCAHVAGESNVTKNNSVDFKSASLFIPWKHTWAHTSWSRFDSHHTNLRDNPTKFKYFKRGQRRLLFVMMVLTCSILIDREPSFSLLILTYYFRKSISLHLLSICMCVCSLSIACMIVMIRRWESAFPPPSRMLCWWWTCDDSLSRWFCPPFGVMSEKSCILATF